MTSLSKNSLVTFITEVLLFITGFIVAIIIARVLGPAGDGIYSLILLIPGIMISFGNFGIGPASAYFVGSKKYKIEDVVSNSLILALFLGFILILIFGGLFQLGFFQKFIHSNQISPLYLWIIVLTIPISLLLSFLQSIIGGRGELIDYNKIRILQNFLQLVAVIILLLILKQGIFGAVFSSIFSIIVTTLFVIILIKKITEFRLFLNKNLLKDSFTYGGKVSLANALSFLNYRSDMFFLAFYLTPAAVGFYSVAVSIAERLLIIPGSFATALFPRVSSNNLEANDLTPRVTRHAFFILFISSLLLFFLARPLITLIFGSAFLPSITPLVILLPGIIVFGVESVLAADLAARGKPEFAVYSSFACLIVDTTLNFILIPKWGVSGAALASSISYLVDTLIFLVAFLKISKKSLSEVLLIKKEDFQDYLKIFSNLKEWIQLNKIE